MIDMIFTTGLMIYGALASAKIVGSGVKWPYFLVLFFVWAFVVVIDFFIVKYALKIKENFKLILAAVSANIASTIVSMAPGFLVMMELLKADSQAARGLPRLRPVTFYTIISSDYFLAIVTFAICVAIELPIFWLFFRKEKLSKFLYPVIYANAITTGILLVVRFFLMNK